MNADKWFFAKKKLWKMALYDVLGTDYYPLNTVNWNIINTLVLSKEHQFKKTYNGNDEFDFRFYGV